MSCRYKLRFAVSLFFLCLTTVSCSSDDDSDDAVPDDSVLLTDDVAESIDLISIDTLQATEGLLHSSHIPLSNATPDGPLLVTVLFRRKPTEFALTLRSELDAVDTALTFDPRSFDDENYFFSEFEAPSSSWTYTLSGTSAAGDTFLVNAPVQIQ